MQVGQQWLDGRTQSFLVNRLHLKEEFTITVDETSPAIVVNAKQVLHSQMPYAR